MKCPLPSEPKPSLALISNSLQSLSRANLGYSKLFQAWGRAMLRFWVCHQAEPSQPNLKFLSRASSSSSQLGTLWHCVNPDHLPVGSRRVWTTRAIWELSLHNWAYTVGLMLSGFGFKTVYGRLINFSKFEDKSWLNENHGLLLLRIYFFNTNRFVAHVSPSI